jgi:flagellar FliJ protein
VLPSKGTVKTYPMERRFRLQSVLNFRANREEMLHMELGKLQADELAARTLLDEFRAESERTLADTAERLGAGKVDVSAVEQGFIYAEAVNVAIGVQLGITHEIGTQVEAKRAEVVTAMQDRKVLEKLKQRHERAYDQWATRVEQALIDDMTTVRYNRQAAAGEGVLS